MATKRKLEASNARHSSRRGVQIKVNRVDAGQPEELLVLNLSETGLLVQSSAALKVGQPIEVDIPHAGQRSATVVWDNGQLFGCQFDEPITRAAVSAAQLQSIPVRTKTDVGADTPLAQPDTVATVIAEESFGKRLKRLRTERKITLIGLARRVKVSKPTLWKWEKDDVRPRARYLAPLAQALEVTQSELLFGHGEPGATATATSRDSSENAPHRNDAVVGQIAQYKALIAGLVGTTPEKVVVTITV